MRRNIIALAVILSWGAIGCEQGGAPSRPAAEVSVAHVPLSAERFAELSAMESWDTIAKPELARFFIQTYDDETVADWMPFAYRKMQSFSVSQPTAEQRVRFEAIIGGPHPHGKRDAMYRFMMVMTRDQIEMVGY